MDIHTFYFWQYFYHVVHDHSIYCFTMLQGISVTEKQETVLFCLKKISSSTVNTTKHRFAVNQHDYNYYNECLIDEF